MGECETCHDLLNQKMDLLRAKKWYSVWYWWRTVALHLTARKHDSSEYEAHDTTFRQRGRIVVTKEDLELCKEV